MNNVHCPRILRAEWLVPLGMLLMLPLGGCQSYERSPMDLRAHRDLLNGRLEQTEPIGAFAERLHKQHPTSERFDLDDGLTLGEAEVFALFYNRDLRMARLRADVALAQRDGAGLWEDPVLGFDGADVLSAGDPFELGVKLSLTIPISGRLGVERSRADAAYALELRRVHSAEWDCRVGMRKAWASWSSAVIGLELLGEQIERIEQVSSIADRLEQAGELARSESRLLRIELVERRSEYERAQLEASSLRAGLLERMGLGPDAELVLVPGLVEVELVGLDDPIEHLISSNMELAVLRDAYRVAEESLRLEVRKQYPDISIGGGYGREDDKDRLLLGFSIPIPVLNANRGAIGTAHAQRELARAEAETAFERLMHAYASAFARRDSLDTQRDLYVREVVPMIEEQSEEIARLIELGSVNTLLLLETITRGYEAKSRLLELRLAHQHATIELSWLLGPDEAIDGAKRIGDKPMNIDQNGGQE